MNSNTNNPPSGTLSGLNDKQLEAVSFPEKSTLVLAGAGSGKTSVLTRRIAFLIENGLNPSAIMAVTFTNKAAEEMKKRLKKIVGRDAVDEMWVGTFHSLCNRLLRQEHEAANLPKNFAILDTDGQELLVKQILKALKAERQTTTPDPSDPLSKLDMDDGDGDKAKKSEDGLKPSEVLSQINKLKEAGKGPGDIGGVPGSDEHEISAVFELYAQACEEQGLLDFNDLLTKAVELLDSNEEVRNSVRVRFKSILVDEFQDTNDVQYKWLQLMKGRNSFVMAVGDDDQSIYGFRGANPENMQRYQSEMADGSVIRLEQNYRSLPFILESANELIAKNTTRLGKNLWTDQKANPNEKIVLTEYQNGYSEANRVAAKVKSALQNGVPANEIAILYRTNAQSRLMESEMNKVGIPVTVYGGFKFFERQEVKNAMAYLDLACSLDRDISMSRVINFPPRGIGERTVEDLRQQAKENNVSMMQMIGLRCDDSSFVGNGAAAKKKQDQLENFALQIIDMSELSTSGTLTSLVEAVVRSSGLIEHYAAQSSSSEEAEERLSNLQEFIASARQFEMDYVQAMVISNRLQSGKSPAASEVLPEYLAYINLMTSTSKSDLEQKKTVSLMTVHASKGLEFDHVFVTGLEDGTFPHRRALKDVADEVDQSAEEPHVSKDVEEERRLMYVALTRARKKLDISMARYRMAGAKDVEMKPSRFLRELPQRHLKALSDQSSSHYSYGNQGANQPWKTVVSSAGERGRLKPASAGKRY